MSMLTTFIVFVILAVIVTAAGYLLGKHADKDDNEY